MRPALPLLAALCLALAACASPRARCMQPIANDLATVQALIVETEQNLARGFGYRVEQRPVTFGINYCAGSYGDGVGINLCGGGINDLVRVPVAIDSVTERRKLSELQAREAQLARAVPEAEAACAARYPG
jgi:hypothetical protein